MENINSGNVLHRAFSVFLFNSNYELLLQVIINALRKILSEIENLERESACKLDYVDCLLKTV